MNYKLEKIENNTVKLEVTVPVQEFQKATEKAYNKNVQKFNVPGFRKGKAPRAIIESLYGKDVFHEDAAYMVVDDTWPKAVDDNNLEPVDRPELINIDYSLDKDLVYTVKVTVKPEVELGEYKGVKVEKVEFPVTDEDVEKQLQSMREKNARIINKEDGVVEKGDTAVIDFEGFIDGVPFEGGKDTNHSLEIGSGSFIEGFEDGLIGKKAGEEVDINVTFPEDYRAEELAGKAAVFKVKINEIKYKELLPLDDEFAKDVSEFETLDELKADLRKKLVDDNELRAKRQYEDSVIKAAVENANVDIPKVMVDREIDYMLENLNYRLQYQGLSLEQYVQYTNSSIDKMKEDYRDAALNSVKTELVLQKVSKVENIVPSDEDTDQEIERMAKQYNQEIDKFRASLQEREMEIIKNEVVTRKTIDFLVQNASVTA